MHVCIISLRIQPAVATAYSDEKFGSRITIHDQEYRFQTSFSSLDCLCYFFFFLLVPNCLLEFCWPFFRVSRVLLPKNGMFAPEFTYHIPKFHFFKCFTRPASISSSAHSSNCLHPKNP